MKKSVLLALAALAVSGTPALAQEVTYEPDCSQGLLMNPNKSNWFMTVQGGGNFYFSKHDINAPIKDRFGAKAGLYFGKWVNPVFGLRFGANWTLNRGAEERGGDFIKYGAYAKPRPSYNNTYEERWMGLGPEFDVLLNLTNWFCGYKPNRVYNFILHGGAGGYWTWNRNYGNAAPSSTNKLDWHAAHNTIMFMNAGIMNSFRLSSVVDLFLDIQYTLVDFKPAATHEVAAQLGLNFNFGKSTWDCPVSAKCPTWKYTDAEGDALVAKLAAKDRQIADLQQQLDACLKRPMTQTVTKVADCEGLATVYYPINQYGLSAREKTILKSVASVMQESNKNYVLTGWADNYTGTDEINARLRQLRADGVKDYLVKCGVNPDQLQVEVDNNNLTDYGVKSAPLDRAVTIRLAK